MPRLSFYIIKQLIGPVILFAFLMTCVIWLTQSLHLLDLVINRGQSAPTFFYLSILVIPYLLVLILPIAFFAGALYALNRLSSESELVVMASAGFSRAQFVTPVLVAAMLTMAASYACGLYLMPLGQRELKDKVVDIRADIGSALLNEGVFNTPSKGLTVFIRKIGTNGHLRGILVHDSRNEKNQVTYLAQTGQLVQTPEGVRLVMERGIIEQTLSGGARLEMLQFQRYVFDLEQFSSPTKANERAANEQYLSDLFHPDASLRPRTKKAYIAEAHNRLTQPLYCLAFAFIVMAAVTRGRRRRGAQVLRLTIASALAAVLRIVGYGVQGLAAGNTVFCILFYIIPILATVLAIAVFFEWLPKKRPPQSTPLNEVAA